jgi:hypothetical protein
MNYKTHLNRSLYPQRTFVQGELQQIDWFAAYDPTSKVFSDLILRVTVAYERDAVGFALSRTTTRTWYTEDGSAAEPNKVPTKYYFGRERDQEGVKRRTNIVNQIKTAAAGHLVLGAAQPWVPAQAEIKINLGRSYTDARSAKTDSFISVSSKALYEDILDDTLSPDAWLDETLRIGHTGAAAITHPSGISCRQYLLAELNIWGL